MNRSRFALLATCVIVAFAGYRLGRGGNDATPTAADAVLFATKSTTLSSSGEGTDLLFPEEMAAAKADLRQRFADHVSPGQDWILRHRTASMLARMSAADLGRFAAELLPSPTGADPLAEWQADLLKEVYRAWAKKDPASACTGHANIPFTFMSRSAAFYDWLRRDPQTARVWLAEADSPQDPARTACRKWLLNNDAVTDFERAAETVGQLDVQTRESTILGWSWQLASDRDSRQQLAGLIAAQENPDFAMKCYQSLVAGAGMNSLSDSEELLENAALREADRRELFGRLYQNEVGRLANLDDAEERRARLSELYRTWQEKQPEEIAAWLAAMSAEARTHLESAGFGGDAGLAR